MAHFNLSSNRLESYDAMNIDILNSIEQLLEISTQNIILMTQIYILGMTVRGGEGSSIVGTIGKNTVQQFESGAPHNNHVRHHRNQGRPFEDTIGSAQVLASKKFTGLYTGPYFDPGMPRNITAQMGDTALITCNVNQIGKFQVQIWIISLTFITQWFKNTSILQILFSFLSNNWISRSDS